MEEVCSICKYGDGKWKEGRKVTNFHLPVCHLCQNDGWKKATSKDILDDPMLGRVVNHIL